MKITKEDFEDYVRVQESGRTNMFAVGTVVALSDQLTKEKCFEIMERYSELEEEFKED